MKLSKGIITVCLAAAIGLGLTDHCQAAKIVTLAGGGMQGQVFLNMTKKELIERIGAPDLVKSQGRCYSYETFGLTVFLNDDLKVNRIYLDRNFKGSISEEEGRTLSLGGSQVLEALSVQGTGKEIKIGTSEEEVMRILGPPDAYLINGYLLNYGRYGLNLAMDLEKRVKKISIDQSFKGTIKGTTTDAVGLHRVTGIYGTPKSTKRLAYAPSSKIRSHATVELETNFDPAAGDDKDSYPLEYRGQNIMYELYGKGMVLKYKYVLDNEGIAFYMDQNQRLYATVIYPPYKKAELQAAREAKPAEDRLVCLEMVHFDFDKANIKSVYIPVLNKWVAYLKQHQNAYVIIEGHTDSKGSVSYNQGLSERRSTAVYNYFLKNGIEPERLRIQGFSERVPIAPNTTASGRDNPEGRALNRRVQFKVFYPRS